jgi:RNA polymerase sigma-70 factor (ECF subfamily)
MSPAPGVEARARADQAMDRYAEGDPAAFEVLYDALAPGLFGFAMNLARHRGSAEDVVQQVFLQIHRARGRWVRGAQVFPWAYAIAHHAFVDSIRRRRHEAPAESEALGKLEAVSEEPGADGELDTRRRLAELQRQIEQLPGGLRLAFQLVVLEELSVTEAAQVIGITTGNVKVRVHRARAILKRSSGLRGEASPAEDGAT